MRTDELVDGSRAADGARAETGRDGDRAESARARIWRGHEQPPPEIEELLGTWWEEGEEVVLLWRDGHLEARIPGAPPRVKPSVFEPEGSDLYRVVTGRERGERLEVVRDDSGVVVKLYWATYPLTRQPELFGPRQAD